MSRELEVFFQEIKKLKKQKITTPYLIVDKLGVSRRGWRVINTFNDLLNKYELTCTPEFANAYFYGEVEISCKPTLGATGPLDESKHLDPTPRLSLLKGSNLNKLKELNKQPGLITVKPTDSIVLATSLMMKFNFSQLPIVSTPTKLIGLISWRSIGINLAKGKVCTTVMDCWEKATEVGINEPIFKAVNLILEKEVVIVRDENNTISGIVTATDLGELFLNLSEPFLIIEQIENHIRQLLHGKFNMDDLITVLDIKQSDKEIKSLADLTFGHYIRIIENPKLFEKLEIKIDRGILIDMLDSTRKIRNEVMHFNPERMKEGELETLRQTLNFLHAILDVT